VSGRITRDLCLKLAKKRHLRQKNHLPAANAKKKQRRGSKWAALKNLRDDKISYSRLGRDDTKWACGNQGTEKAGGECRPREKQKGGWGQESLVSGCRVKNSTDCGENASKCLSQEKSRLAASAKKLESMERLSFSRLGTDSIKAVVIIVKFIKGCS